jgi:drug/metabolite transporter (DMT)-like permease
VTVEARRSAIVATLTVIVGAFCFSTISVFTILATRSGAPLLTVLAGRYVVAAMVLVPVAGMTALRAVDRTQALRLMVIGGGVQAAVAYATMSALTYIPAATMVFLFYTYPGWLFVIAAVRRSERVTAGRAIALALSLVGVATMVGMPGAGELHPLGATLALVSAVAYAWFLPLVRRLKGGLPASSATAYLVFGVLAFSVTGAFSLGGLELTLAPVAWLSIVGVGTVGTAMSLILLMRGLSVLGPVRTSIVATVEPFFTGMLAATLLGQPLRSPTLIGGVLIAAAVVVLQMHEENAD